MATKRTERAYSKTVQIPLTPEMTERITFYETNTQALLDAMIGYVNSGYAVSFRTSFKPEGVSCSIMPQDANLPNAGIMIFGNSDNCLSALAVMVAKIDFLGVDSDWEGLSQSQSGRKYS